MDIDIDNLIDSIVNKLKSIRGIKAIVLGGSRADGSNRPDSDIDLGIYYDDPDEFDVIGVKKLANEINEIPNPIVTVIGEWGKWVNGGAWLTVQGQRVDFLYRDLNFVSQIIQDCKKGIKQSDYYQQPPYGFHSYIYCAEIKICEVLFDPENIIQKLKLEVKDYPQALKKTIINGFLWDAEFSLEHCKKFAQRGEALLVSGCLTRITSDFVQALYALNDTFFIGDKKLYKQEPEFTVKPGDFLNRMDKILGNIGNSSIEMTQTVDSLKQLLEEFIGLAGLRYTPKFRK